MHTGYYTWYLIQLCAYQVQARVLVLTDVVVDVERRKHGHNGYEWVYSYL